MRHQCILSTARQTPRTLLKLDALRTSRKSMGWWTGRISKMRRRSGGCWSALGLVIHALRERTPPLLSSSPTSPELSKRRLRLVRLNRRSHSPYKSKPYRRRKEEGSCRPDILAKGVSPRTYCPSATKLLEPLDVQFQQISVRFLVPLSSSAVPVPAYANRIRQCCRFGEIDTYSRRYRETNLGGIYEVFRKILKKAGKPSDGHIYIDKFGENKASRSIRVQMDGVHSIILRNSFDTMGGPDERDTSRSRLRVASEVATTDLVRSYGIPAPKIVEYSCTADNPLGHAYIAFEQPTGSAISRFWMDLDDSERLKLVDELVDIEKLLWSIELPAFGSLYYSHDLPEHFHAHRVPDHGEARGLYGPCKKAMITTPHTSTYSASPFRRSLRPRSCSSDT